MESVIVGVADCRISNRVTEELVTYALGSCIAVAIYDPVAQVAGLLHFMLPDSKIDLQKSSACPWMFADTGIPLLFQSAYQKGADKKRLLVHVAGGAQMLNDNGLFNIGKRNHAALRACLWRAGVLIKSEVVGGTAVRTVGLDTATGKFWVRETNKSQGGPM